MSTIVTRTGKGSPLSWEEADANFTNLNTDKLEAGSPASNISVIPVGSITATDVQAAIAELDSEKEPADVTILKTADIGVTVQAYDADIITIPATQLEMTTGTEQALRAMSPLRIAQAITALVPFASAVENAAGTVENKAVDPLGIREAFNATGTAPIYACRAWVNFNGTGTVAIRASGNVSSITDLGVGTYGVNFITAMPDIDYAAAFGGRIDTTDVDANSLIVGERRRARTVSTLTVSTVTRGQAGASSGDGDLVSVVVFR